MNVLKIGKLKLWEKYCEEQRKIHPLTYLFWECTLRCNLRCNHCGSSCSSDQNIQDELSTEEIIKAFQSIANDFNPKKITIGVTGGEPLLRKDLFEVMEHATNMGFSWGMVTNGTLISTDIIEKMKKAQLSTISISLDGLEESHNWLRCNDNAFKNTVNGIKLLVNSKDSELIEIITCVTKKNLKDLDEIYNLINDLGITHWRLGTIFSMGRAENNSELILNSKEVNYLLEYIKKKRKEKGNLAISFSDEGFLGLEYEGEVRDQFFYCWAGIKIGSILYNGDIAACPDIPREYSKQGNIREDRFLDVWNNKYQLFRDRSQRKQGECKNCPWWEFCEGNSLHLWNFPKKELRLCNYNLINKEK